MKRDKTTDQISTLPHIINPGFEISEVEALARLSTDETLRILFEYVPNDGITRYHYEARSAVVQRIKEERCFEAGQEAQVSNYGIYVVGLFRGRVTLMFLPTRPECRLTPEQLRDSVKRGRGADIFSVQTKN